MTGTEPDWVSRNRANWDDRTRVHAASSFYDLPGFRAGASRLTPVERAEIGDVSGRNLLHLQCHMGQDTLSWARSGARVTGLDLSPAAVATACSLARDTGLADRARFVVSDVYDAPSALAGERFDLVVTGLGALVWLPDLTGWARVVASLLVDGGALHLVEFHPVTDMLDEDGATVTEDYFSRGPEVCSEPATYTDGPELVSSESVQWRHPLGEVVTALAAAGLRIEHLHEFDVTYFRRFASLVDEDGTYRFPPGRPRIPLLYALRAVRPGGK